MPSILAVALGGIVFSFLISLVFVLRQPRNQKSEYQQWLEEANKNNIVKDRDRISTWQRVRHAEFSR